MEWFERLSLLYDLVPYEQDMGITNANGARLDEFLQIFLNHEANHKWEWEELVDLVLESANEVMLEGKLTQEQENIIVSIIKEQRGKFPNQYEYWLEFANDNDYPVRKLVRRGGL